MWVASLKWKVWKFRRDARGTREYRSSMWVTSLKWKIWEFRRAVMGNWRV